MTKHKDLKGYRIEWQDPPILAGMWQVFVYSDTPHLMAKLRNGVSTPIEGISQADAVAKAEAYIDSL